MPGADDDRVVMRSMARSAQATSTVTFVGLVRASNTAERFCDWATSASISCLRGVRVDLERHLDVVEAVADVAVGAEDAADVVVALDRRLDRAQLDAAVLRDRRHAGGQAARQADEEVLDRRDAVVLGREDLGVVGVEHRLGLVGLLLRRGRRSSGSLVVLCTPFCHLEDARQVNCAASGAPFSTSRASSSAWTLTPLSTVVMSRDALSVWLPDSYRDTADNTPAGDRAMIAPMARQPRRSRPARSAAVETQYLDLPEPVRLDCGRRAAPGPGGLRDLRHPLPRARQRHPGLPRAQRRRPRGRLREDAAGGEHPRRVRAPRIATAPPARVSAGGTG